MRILGLAHNILFVNSPTSIHALPLCHPRFASSTSSPTNKRKSRTPPLTSSQTPFPFNPLPPSTHCHPTQPECSDVWWGVTLPPPPIPSSSLPHPLLSPPPPLSLPSSRRLPHPSSTSRPPHAGFPLLGKFPYSREISPHFTTPGKFLGKGNKLGKFSGNFQNIYKLIKFRWIRIICERK